MLYIVAKCLKMLRKYILIFEHLDITLQIRLQKEAIKIFRHTKYFLLWLSNSSNRLWFELQIFTFCPITFWIHCRSLGPYRKLLGQFYVNPMGIFLLCAIWDLSSLVYSFYIDRYLHILVQYRYIRCHFLADIQEAMFC